MDPESYDIQSHSILSEYECHPKILEQYCLADFSSLLQIVYPKNVTLQDPFEDNLEDDPVDPNKKSDHIIAELSNGIVLRRQEIPQIICYRNYNRKTGPKQLLQREANAVSTLQKRRNRPI